MHVLALLALGLTAISGIGVSASYYMGATELPKDTPLGNELGFPQMSLPWAPPDASSIFTPFFGTGGIRIILIAADDGSEDEAADQDSSKKGDHKDEDEGAGSWDPAWDAPQIRSLRKLNLPLSS